MKILSLLIVPLFFPISFMLLWKRKINAAGLAGLIVALAYAAGFLYNAESIKKMSTKLMGGELVTELEDIRNDVFAKTETVRKIGEETAELVTFTALNVGRFVSSDLQGQLLQTKDRVILVLKEIGADEAKIRNVSNKFDKRIADDLCYEVVKVVENTTANMINQARNKNLPLPFEREQVLAEVRKKLETYGGSEKERAMFLEYLQKQNISDAKIASALDGVDLFLKTGNLKSS